jgi:hypothetical protein
VLHDTDYTPLFGSETAPPIKKGSNVFEKLDRALIRQGAVLMVGPGWQGKRESNAVDVPQRVMVGGADSMENLLPKSSPKSP